MEERFIRQTVLPQVGTSGQEKIEKAVVTVIGAGGLGCPVLTYLVEAGVQQIRIIDCDVVGLSNLNRQFLHTTQDINKPKVQSAAEKLQQLNPQVRLELIDQRLTVENMAELIGAPDVVVDCLDSIAVRLLVGEYCLRYDIPLVEGGIKGFYGWVTTINRKTPCLACLGYHAEMEETEIPVLGTTAGVIGSLQANECLKLILGAGTPLTGRMLHYDGLSGSIDEIALQINPNCPVHSKLC
ncbi:MAG: HesA/MoeB/ThiF family protein [Peptococcaceae bacterium]|nr:HesA/MoeB/ThiF family protein [Peptococcaceae bacterium]